MKYLIAFVLLFLSGSIFAQTRNIEKMNSFKTLIIQGGFNNGIRNGSRQTMSGGLGFGAEYYRRLKKRYFINVKAVYQAHNYETGNYNIKTKYLHISAPVTALINVKELNGDVDAVFTLGIGPYFATALSGKLEQITTPYTTTTMKFGNGNTANRQQLDYGINLKLGLNFSRFLVNLEKNVGKKNVLPSTRQTATDRTLYLRNVNVGIAYIL